MSTDNANSVYVDLLKKSEKYCEQNNLTTASDLLAVVNDTVQDITDEAFREFLLSMMKDAAYYSTCYDEDSDDTLHYVACYNANHEYPFLIISLFEQGSFVVSYYIDTDHLNGYFKNTPPEKLKNFKCLEQNNQKEGV